MVALGFTVRGRIDVDLRADVIRIDHFTEVWMEWNMPCQQASLLAVS